MATGSQQGIITAMSCWIASSLSASGAEKLGVAQTIAALAWEPDERPFGPGTPLLRQRWLAA
jgi:hypothetical protein